MKYLFFSILSCYFLNFSFSQTCIEKTQGYWEEEVDDFESYVVVNGNFWYSIIRLDDEIDISREWFGFYDDFETETIMIKKNSFVNGQYVIFLNQENSKIIKYEAPTLRKYFKFYEFDLDQDYLTYYANNPVQLNRIAALPKSIQKVYEKRKEELDNAVEVNHELTPITQVPNQAKQQKKEPAENDMK